MTDFDCCVNNEHDKGDGMSNADLIAKATAFREATAGDTLPSEGSIIGLWMATAGALEAAEKELKFRELHHFEEEQKLATAEAKIERALAEADEWINSPSGSIAPTREAGRVFRHILSGGES